METNNDLVSSFNVVKEHKISYYRPRATQSHLLRMPKSPVKPPVKPGHDFRAVSFYFLYCNCQGLL